MPGTLFSTAACITDLPTAICTVCGVPLCSMKVIFGMSAPSAGLSDRYRQNFGHNATSDASGGQFLHRYRGIGNPGRGELPAALDDPPSAHELGGGIDRFHG